MTEDIYRRLADKLGHADSAYLPLIFECAASKRQAMILDALNPPPEPALTADQLADQLGLDAEEIQHDTREHADAARDDEGVSETDKRYEYKSREERAEYGSERVGGVNGADLSSDILQ